MSKKRLKRPRVDWWHVLLSSKDVACIERAYEIYYLHGCQMSKNRCAYAALKSHYSTTKLERVRWLGEAL